ncbi:MAG: DUF1223 domain-containing protein [Pseudomonadota bacterium]
MDIRTEISPHPTGTRPSSRAARVVLVGLAALAVGLIAGQAGAAAENDERAVGPRPQAVSAVIELFTSQGCSACPPADALLQTYAERTDIVALSLPVDYWDYLGWKDTFASAKNTERQRNYARGRGDGAVYTPQAVVNGTMHVIGSDQKALEKALDEQAEAFAKTRLPVQFLRSGNMLVVGVGMPPAGVELKEATVWLAVVQRSGTVEIKRGENGGRTVTYANIVRELAPVGMWSGKPLTLQIAQRAIMQPGAQTCAVLVQQGTSGPIVGAAWLGY